VRAAFLAAALALTACDEEALTRGRAAPEPPASVASAPAPSATVEARPEIAFVRDGKTVRTLPRAELEAALAPEQWTAFDPYYNKPKTYRAVALAALVARGFGEPAAALAKNDYVMRARDGYAVPLTGARVFEKGGYVALADVEVPAWEPIGQQRANPGPFYLVWREPAQQSLDTYPRPWQLASIEIAPFEATYPHTVPLTPADAPATRGFRIFRESCIACHAVNREGGRVGPDLNVPRSIVEYRPEPQIRAYIRDPRAFRYSNMPAHPNFSEADLDGLVAYFHAMKDRKHDPEAGKAGGH
jgi:mono/diheme cytochrome c family protein